jgi:hypothetical protein
MRQTWKMTSAGKPGTDANLEVVTSLHHPKPEPPPSLSFEPVGTLENIQSIHDASLD